MKIICGDPGLYNDPFGVVGIEYAEGEIYVKFARQYAKTPYKKIADDLQFLKNMKIDFFGLETNNRGKIAIEAFKQYGHTVHGINTVAKLGEKNNHKWQSMDKSFTINYLKDLLKNNHIHFPKNPSSHVKVLIDQIEMIKGFRNLNGTMSYKAMSGRHDDLFMAFLLCCHISRIYTEKAIN